MPTIRQRLYAATWLTDFAIGLLLFTVSRNMAERGLSMIVLGAVGAGTSLAWAVSSVLCGSHSDRHGRRALMVGGILLLLTAAAGCALLDRHLFLYIAFYWMGGVAGGMIYPPLIAWLNQGSEDSASGHRKTSRVLINFCLSWNAGLVCGQLSGGSLFALHPSWPLALAAGLSIANLGVVWSMKEAPRAAPPADALDSTPPPALRRLSAAFALIGWVANLSSAFCVGMIFHIFPSLAVSLGVPSERHGVMLAVMRVFTVGTYLVMHHMRFWHHRFSVMLLAQGVAVGGLLLLTFTRSELSLTAGLSGLGMLLGFNYFASLYYGQTSSKDENKGLASGIHEATLGLGLAGGALAGGVTGSAMGLRAPYVLGIGAIALLALVQAGLYVKRVRSLTR